MLALVLNKWLRSCLPVVGHTHCFGAVAVADRAHRLFREKRAPGKCERKQYTTGIIFVGRKTITHNK